MKNHIVVTQTDINNGQKRSAQSCPIALAVKRDFPKKDVEVTTEVWLYDEDMDYWSGLPNEAVRFIADFDNGEPVAPFDFYVDWEEA